MSSTPLEYQTHFSARSSLREWLFWFTILLLSMGMLTVSLFTGNTILGLHSDVIAYTIIGILASLTLFRSFGDALFLSRETLTASQQVAELVELDDIEQFLKKTPDSLFRSHINSLFTIFQENHEISQETLIGILNDKLHAKNRVSELFSSILITMGLIGTIMGLIVMVGKLRLSLGDFDPENTTLFISSLMVEGGALSGLDTAFYTTLLGAILGGVVLRILTNVIEANITKYVTHIAELTEVHVLPSMRSHALQLYEVGFYKKS